MGRTKKAGAPLGQREEFDVTDLSAVPDRWSAMPQESHVFLSPERCGNGHAPLRLQLR